MQIAALVFDALTALDVVGPMEVLSRLPGAKSVIVAKSRSPVQAEGSNFTFVPDATLEDVSSPDIVVIPGGRRTDELHGDTELMDWLRRVHAAATWTLSVCTGSHLLAAAGLLKGKRATTHWATVPTLERYGATYTPERVVNEGSIVTAAGVSSGIDAALWLAARVAGERAAQAIQLSIEYDPQPPFDCGSPAKAGPELVALLRG